jgi:hypothetical protein
MKRTLFFLGMICSIGEFSSCMKEESPNELLNTSSESQEVFVKRNAGVVVEIENFILENQELILKNKEKISAEFNGNLYAYFSSIRSDEFGFSRVVGCIRKNDRLNQTYYSTNTNKSNIVEKVIAEINQSNNKYINVILDDSGDRKTCMILYRQNASDCRESFYCDATFAVLAAGIGGFVSGLLPALNAGWGLIECQNRAQRNFDYCLGNI